MTIERPGILALIGKTPLVELRKLHTNRAVRVYAKLESRNPGGSVKDRVALSMIEGAEHRGDLKPGMTVLEPTSGNTGIGLAVVCAVKGYRLLLTMSEGASVERRKVLRALGAEILLTPAERGTDGAIEKAYQMAREEPEAYYVPDQFNNPDNWLAHYQGTAQEIWDDTHGMITHAVATTGTTGTLMGISRRLKELNRAIQVIGVEPTPGHKIQGLKNLKESYVPGIFEKERLDLKVNVEDEESFEMVRRLAREEGIFAGMSSGAALAGALKIARGLQEGLVVVILPDGGDRYLSTSLFVPREIPTFCFYNTLSRRKENFVPLEPGRVRMYSCGPTVDDRVHLGVCRRVVTADLVRRYLEHKGFRVQQVMNVTDLDDRTILGSEESGLDLKAFTQRYIDAFMEDLDALEVQRADAYPRASEHLGEMMRMARTLEEKGYAYEQHGSLYFDISKFGRYGQLSRVDLGKIRVGSTVDLDDYDKDNPRDFTLVKRSTLSELKRGIFFPSPWGNARPGWHLECAAMSTHFLGETIDLHTSGNNLIFPHHENEIAICEAATGKPFVRYWLHSEQVLVDGKKISRELGNYVTVADLRQKGFHGREIRLFLLSAHYRKPLQFTYRALYTARRIIQRLEDFALRLRRAEGEGVPEVGERMVQAREAFEAAMDDDLNVSGALGAVFTLVGRLNPLLSQRRLDPSHAERALEFLREFNGIFRILTLEEGPPLDEGLMELIRQRDLARHRRDWEEADRIREQLASMGIRLVDTPQGSHWVRA
jgi:cysteinyl-tRNA synthetase